MFAFASCFTRPRMVCLSDIDVAFRGWVLEPAAAAHPAAGPPAAEAAGAAAAEPPAEAALAPASRRTAAASPAEHLAEDDPAEYRAVQRAALPAAVRSLV